MSRERRGDDAPPQQRVADLQADERAGARIAVAPRDPGVAAISNSTVVAATGDVYIGALPNPSDDAALRECYLARVADEAGQLKLQGIDPQVAGSLRGTRFQLDAVYTALLTRGGAAQRLDADGAAEQARERRPPSALEQLDQHPRLVLVGDPGSGKSTVVDFVALCLATGALDALRAALPGEEEPQPWRHGALLPVRVILRDLAARGLPEPKTPATAATLWSFLRQELQSAGLGDFFAPLQRELQGRGGLLLFDGLDEVPTAADRRDQIRSLVEDVARSTPRCRIVVTSRTYAYHREGFRLSGFVDAELLPFTPAQIDLFVERFYGHCGGPRGQSVERIQGGAAELRSAIQRSPQLRELASRPLLLTLMASLHISRGGRLPEGRAKLYEATVQLLLDIWESPKVVRDAAGRAVLQQPSLAEVLSVGHDRVRELLSELACEVHGAQAELQGTADIPADRLVRGLLALSADPDLKPRQLIAFLEDRAGLLVPRGTTVYTFPHRTFQEYLAACHMVYPGDLADKVRADPERWREVALLGGARADEPLRWQLIDELCPQEPGTGAPADAWGAQVAGQVLVESANLTRLRPQNQRLLERVKRWLRHLMRSGELPARERALSGANLDLLCQPGEEREEITVPGMPLCYVPPGPFWMGSEDGADHEKPAHVVAVPYGYLIGKYPVTNRQYQEFVAAGGYGQQALWAEAALIGRWRSGRYRNSRDEWISAPPLVGGPGHPAVGVSWYEALAFCRWLGQRLGEGWRCALPSEAEWEKAARGGLQVPESAQEVRLSHAAGWRPGAVRQRENPQPRREYPCGDEMTPEQANYDESGVGATSAVGCFPAGASPLGCEEQSGNVWEWTRTLWATRYPYQPDDGREALDAKVDIGRVIRGGVYIWEIGNARCAFRLPVLPHYRRGDSGFRVVAAHTSRL